MNRNKIVFIIVMILVIVYAGFMLFMPHMHSESIVGDKKVLDEITRLDILSSQRQLTDSDLINLETMVHHDDTAMDYVDEIKWLAEHNESSHASHSLGFLYNYVQSGKDVPCIPHELQHLTLYIKYNDTENLNKTINEINEKYDIWYNNTKEYYKFNNIYESQVNKTGQDIRRITEQISEGNRTEHLLDEANLIADEGLC